MSFDYSSFSFEPTTPPQFAFEETLTSAPFRLDHSRSSSQVSMYSRSSSPSDSISITSTRRTTPARSPIRQHGPLLLPKIRPQDQEISASPSTSMRVTKSSKKSAAGHALKHNRSYTNPEKIVFNSDIFPSSTRPMSTLCSPMHAVQSIESQHRRSSSSSLDGQTLGKYGFPTYRQMPNYIQQSPNLSVMESYSPQPHERYPTPAREPSPLAQSINIDDITPTHLDNGSTTNLATYLTSQNPAPALVRQLNIHVRDTNAKHFWWDIRQIRPWTSFNTDTISSIPGFHSLLNLSLPSNIFHQPSRACSNPENEQELQNIYTQFYATKLNHALSISQGTRHLMIRASSAMAQKSGDPSYISNYTDDVSKLIYGRGLGRVVGLVKSFDRWNTGMRVEGNHRKVEYLRGLAHLHKCMRENNCRYGFIMTEIELVVVRNGSESVPHFGYLEVQTIQLAAHSTPPCTSTSSFPQHETSDSNAYEKPLKMTALLALWYLHMLARDEILPGQLGWKTEIGAPAEGTRRKILPKDDWIPEPQLAEKREAKRGRGWVWPEESVGRKELGKRGLGIRFGGPF
ncbi:efa940de-2c1f-4848-adca-a5ad3c418785 [Sclerotinia trifoliorum]|uniref:Efa940de-2c1f-4848-adca-a5ad3c418785 n=1 Tax=Sclerotinia trifoliorum TaxID=28548 RepID=A0A8H2VZ70_9HELO|nr:efa940de-2c1f-4848-adca-a5ad3c418785 [Sclerotinia trifoliorum]